jgi:predicted nuclease of restriction endonuclease-like (RecB) superfamily
VCGFFHIERPMQTNLFIRYSSKETAHCFTAGGKADCDKLRDRMVQSKPYVLDFMKDLEEISRVTLITCEFYLVC